MRTVASAFTLDVKLPRFKATSHTRACLPTILERRSDVDDDVVVVPFWGVWLFVTALRDDDLSSVASSSSVLSVVFVFVFVFFFFFFFFGISRGCYAAKGGSR